MRPGLSHRRKAWKNHEAKLLIIKKIKNKTNSNRNNEDL